MILNFVVYFCASFLLCILIENRAASWGLMDPPGGRKMQKMPIPRAGGLAIFLTFAFSQLFFHSDLPAVFWIGATVVFIGGFYDDRKPHNSVYTKLIFQLTAAGCAACLPLTGLHLTVTYQMIFRSLIFVFTLGMINSFNLMDNMNGLTSGMALVMLVIWTVAHIVSPVVSIPLIAGALGFFVRNFPKGRIFLGDQGSQFLGYSMSALCIFGLSRHMGSHGGSIEFAWDAVFFLLCSFLLFAVDTTLVVMIRLKKKVSIFIGDQNHLSHQLLRRGLTAKQVASLMFALQGLASVFAVFLAFRMGVL